MSNFTRYVTQNGETEKPNTVSNFTRYVKRVEKLKSQGLCKAFQYKKFVLRVEKREARDAGKPCMLSNVTRYVLREKLESNILCHILQDLW